MDISRFAPRYSGPAVAWLIAALSCLSPARAAEVCLYSGMTSHSGHAAVRTDVTEAGGLTTLDVTARLDAEPWWLWTVQYLAEEISTWRAGELQSVAVNNRYSVNGRVKRQQWDVFIRGPDGLVASRVQSKTLSEFRRRHPAFAGHWEPSRFGQAWLPDYPAARPERRRRPVRRWLWLSTGPAGCRPEVAPCRCSCRAGSGKHASMPWPRRSGRDVGAWRCGIPRWTAAPRHRPRRWSPRTIASCGYRSTFTPRRERGRAGWTRRDARPVEQTAEDHPA